MVATLMLDNKSTTEFVGKKTIATVNIIEQYKTTLKKRWKGNLFKKKMSGHV